jgi:hypothetical protein
MRGDQGAQQGSATSITDLSPPMLEVAARHRVNQVAFADGRPVQAIGFIEDDFIRVVGARSSMTRTHEHFHHFLIGGAIRMGNNHCRVRFPPTGRLPRKDIERFQSWGSGNRRAMWRPIRASTFSHSGSRGSFLMTGMSTILKPLAGLWRLISHVYSSNCSIVTRARGGHSGGRTIRRLLSTLAAFMVGSIPPKVSQVKPSRLEQSTAAFCIGLNGNWR